MNPTFVHLNSNWNADPNVPDETVTTEVDNLSLTFNVNSWAHEGGDEGQRMKLQFIGCTKWRLGLTNDEGWYSGKCRFSKFAPSWGEFYEVIGNLLLDECPDDWLHVNQGKGSRHFLFYFRDSTFECDAESYEITKNCHS
jgi:hypothetical protein